jgi:hypothetical protein
VDVDFASGGKMDKTRYQNDFNIEIGQEMHSEVRASLTSVSDLSLSARRNPPCPILSA